MRSTPEITLSLDLSGDSPLPTRLAGELRRLITSGVLAPAEALPSSRALAAHLGIARGSVVAGYDQLLAEGYLAASIGSATIVNPALRQLQHRPQRTASALPTPTEPVLDLRPGRPWAADVAGPAWRAAWRQASLAPVDTAVPQLGLPVLRTSWADHLRRMRGVIRDPEQIAITGGGREGLALLLLALGGRHPLTVGVEEPGYPSLRKVPARFGATVLPLAADEHGLDVSALPTGKAAPELLLVTPSHQYPLGGTLPVDRRQALLEWARRHRVVVVEDDYDSELRYTSQPLPALAALDDPSDGRVVLLGTLAKTLTPALATGFLALPEWLVPAVAGVRSELGTPVGLVPQLALASYLESGALRLHTQRVRNRYRRRRAQVVAALAGVHGVEVYPMDGGLHAVVETRRPETEVVALLAASGVQVSPLSQYWSGTAGRQGIVFGFGSVSDSELARGLQLIAAASATAAEPVEAP